MVPVPANDPERELDDLKSYLGDAYDQRQLERWQEAVNDELAEIGDEQQLYRTSQAYLYNLTVFAMSGTKDPYLALLAEHVPAGARVLDYGCGIGSDGLRLLEVGYDVAFADFDNPSVEYLRWRLKRRGREARIFDLDREAPTGFDAAYAFDVIEHVEEPYAFLGSMEAAADLVLVNFLEDDPAEDEPHHRSLPIGRLVRHGMRRGLVDYRVHYGRSHVVLYRSDRRSARAFAASAAVTLRRGRRGDLPALLLPIPYDFRPWRRLRRTSDSLR
jgi:SAM-dependent methyltransferase